MPHRIPVKESLNSASLIGENTAVWLFETSTDIMKNTWGTWVTESVLPNDLVFYNLFSFLSHIFLFFQLNLQLYSINV